MRVALFDAIREQHVCRSLERAIANLGHEAYWTGPVWTSHRRPTSRLDREAIDEALDEALAFEPDALLCFRPSSLDEGQLERLRGAGIRTLVWLADDPVLYDVGYRQIVDLYDVVLHGGPEQVLEFYERRHGRPTGVYFPFWAGEEVFPDVYDPDGDVDLVFLGNMDSRNRAGRYELLSSLPLRVEVFGTAERDPEGIVSGYLRGPEEISAALGRARLGFTMSQRFSDYEGHEYDFPELSGLGTFDVPSRIVQYAASGLPVVALSDGPLESFPEAVWAPDRDGVAESAQALLADHDQRRLLSQRVRARFERSFSAAARARSLIELLESGDGWREWTLERRARFWMDAPVPEPAEEADEELPTVPVQRDRLAEVRYESPTTYRILHLGAFANGPNDIVASLLRALEQLGHTVLHVDTKRTQANLARGLVDYSEGEAGGFGPYYVNPQVLEPALAEFDPQIIVCNAGGLAWREEDARELKRRGFLLLGLTLSDPDVFPSVKGFAGRFDYHTTNAAGAIPMYEEQGITNTLYFPFGIDREFVLAPVEPAPELESDVICLGHATGRADRNATMKELARHFDVRVYGTGWELPGAEVVQGDRQVQAARAGRIHVNFPATRAEYTNVKCGVFETVGSGGLLCTGRFEEMERFFSYDEEIVGYETETELVGQVGELLEDPRRLETMRRRAFARLVGEHLYEHRWLELFERIEADLAGGGEVVGEERARQLSATLAPRPDPRTVVISGFYGSRNSGDELLLRAIVAGVREAEPELRMVVAGVSPRRVGELHRLPAFARPDLETAELVSRSASAVVLGGGGLWHDYTFAQAGGMPGLFDQPRMSIAGLAVMPVLSSMRRRPFHVVGMGVGPLEDEDARQMVRWVGDQASSISVRDSGSADLLTSIEGWEAPVETVPDPVYALDLGVPRTPEYLRRLGAGRRLLAVNLRPWTRAGSDDVPARVGRALDAVARRHSLTLVGFPMQESPSVDTAAVEAAFAHVGGDVPRVVLDWTPDFSELFGTLISSAVVLSMRLHSCLLAHRLETPVVGLSYDPKVRAHFEELGVESRVLSMEAAAGEIADALDRALSQEGRLEDEVRARVADNEKAAAAALVRLGERLAQAPRVRPAPGALTRVWSSALG